MEGKGEKVIIGMSGGVDSAVAAYLLKRDGYDVVGLFMHNWEEDDEGGACTAESDWEDVRAVSDKLGIPCYSVNFAKEYMDDVFEYFLSEYRAYRTPNPDVLCNRKVKFGAFRDYCMSIGAKKIATGHYCKRAGDMLLRAVDRNKDQSYFLNQVKTQQLDNVLFPIGGMTKPEVRELARQIGLTVADKKDSTGVCFIGERKFKKFLREFLPAQPGDIVDTSGKKVGVHDGLMYYTLGQRRGLDIGGVKGEVGRWFVLDKDVKNNRLVVSCGDESRLYSNMLVGHGLNIIGAFDMGKELRCTAKTRYRQADFSATFKPKGDGTCELYFDEPQRAVTPGQYAVLYLGERCLGGFEIDYAE
ncbi:MAG: tRNA 2-thiouridine(34) synthase MnmA [Clostridiales bacterium]|nr:tRNA 2-thiouridine(34) synthase MnmA [Clostridiales bacterium]